MDQLSKDMIRCKAEGYGTHYGKWHAAVKEPEISREKTVENKSAKSKKQVVQEQERPRCQVCGEEIPFGSRRKVTCSAACADVRRIQMLLINKSKRKK